MKTSFEIEKGPNGLSVVDNNILFLNDIKLTDSNEEDVDCDFID